MKILVVDDEMDMESLFLQTFRREIRAKSVTFEFAFSAEQALGYLKENLPGVGLILSDINMPGMDGLEMLREIKKDHNPPLPPMLMVSAYGDALTQSNAKDAGADGFLTKPLDFSLLKEKLERLTDD